MNVVYGENAVILRGWEPQEDFALSNTYAPESLTGTPGTETVKDITYNKISSTATVRKYNVAVTQVGSNPPVVLESVTPEVCSVSSTGVVARITDGSCTIEGTGQTGKRQSTQTISLAGAETIYESVASLAAGSLRKYLYDQQIAALAGITPGSAAQRAHSIAGDLTSSVNTGNFLRAQLQPGFHPYQLQLLDEIMAGGTEGIRWRAWITPHHYLTWMGHGVVSVPGDFITIVNIFGFPHREVCVRYSATEWTGPLCKLLPADVGSTYLPVNLVEGGPAAVGIWSRMHHTYTEGSDVRWVMPVEYGSEAVFPTNDPRYPYQKYQASGLPMANGGDSGSPAWIGIQEPGNDHATLVPFASTAFEGVVASIQFHGYRTQIQDAVNQLNASGAYTVQTVDLSGFNSYA